MPEVGQVTGVAQRNWAGVMECCQDHGGAGRYQANRSATSALVGTLHLLLLQLEHAVAGPMASRAASSGRQAAKWPGRAAMVAPAEASSAARA